MPGGKMSVYVDGTAVISNYAINLATYGAVDASGSSYVGFAGQTGSWSENNYIANWQFAYSTTLTKVATPVFSPGSGTYNHLVPVVITCATPGAAIRYTTNGGIPSTSSSLYTGSVFISQGSTQCQGLQDRHGR